MDFSRGIEFSQSPCDLPSIGHDTEHPLFGYDLQGMLSLFCPRPYCHRLIKTVAVDDLSREDFDDLQRILISIAQSYEED